MKSADAIGTVDPTARSGCQGCVECPAGGATKSKSGPEGDAPDDWRTPVDQAHRG